MKSHIYCIFDVQEIAHLFAVFVVGSIAFEEINLASIFDLIKGFVNDTTHVFFMIFVGAKDVVIFEADNFIEEALFLGIEVEHVFGVAVHIQGAKRGKILKFVIHALGAISVSSG